MVWQTDKGEEQEKTRRYNIRKNNAEIQLFDSYGHLIKKQSLSYNNKSIELNLQSLTSGIYLLQFITDNDRITKKNYNFEIN